MKSPAFLVALAVVLLTGWVHGRWTQRWADGTDLQAAAARLQRLPLELGDWRGTELEIEAAQLQRAEAAGYIWRRYVRAADGQAVDVVALCGRFGPVSVHTPDVCFGGVGFKTIEAPVRFALRDAGVPAAEFWTTRFEKPGPVPHYLRTFWSWSTGGAWEAPQYPRLTFRAAPVLYKLYVVRHLGRPDEPLEGDAAVALMRRLMPELSAALAGP